MFEPSPEGKGQGASARSVPKPTKSPSFAGSCLRRRHKRRYRAAFERPPPVPPPRSLPEPPPSLRVPGLELAAAHAAKVPASQLAAFSRLASARPACLGDGRPPHVRSSPCASVLPDPELDGDPLSIPGAAEFLTWLQETFPEAADLHYSHTKDLPKISERKSCPTPLRSQFMSLLLSLPVAWTSLAPWPTQFCSKPSCKCPRFSGRRICSGRARQRAGGRARGVLKKLRHADLEV